jgi:hypothetical protein
MAELVELAVTRLLQNPLGSVAPDGARGDIVRVSDGVTKVYLDPAEFDAVSEGMLREMLAQAALLKATSTGVIVVEPGRRARKPLAPVEHAGSPATPRRVRRKTQPIQ